jgi:hypothetical protein
LFFVYQRYHCKATLERWKEANCTCRGASMFWNSKYCSALNIQPVGSSPFFYSKRVNYILNSPIKKMELNER